MTPTELANRTRRFVSPTNWDAYTRGECADLDIIDVKDGDLPMMLSAWKPTMEEISQLLLGAPIWLHIVGTVHPVVGLSVGDPEDVPEEVNRRFLIMTGNVWRHEVFATSEKAAMAQFLADHNWSVLAEAACHFNHDEDEFWVWSGE